MASRKPRKEAKKAKARQAKRSVGRPTDYAPELCAAVVELGREGKSRTQIAATLDVARSTLAEWEKAHPEFKTALQRAKELARAWWEDTGQLGLTMGKDFNATAFIFQMCNRFGRDEDGDEAPYRQRQEVTGEGGAPLLQPVINLSIGNERTTYGSSGGEPRPPPASKAG